MARQNTQRAMAQHTELVAGQLSKYHHKRLMAFKFAEYKPNGLSRLGAMLEAYRRLKSKPKTSTELKEALQVIWATCHRDRSTRL